MNKSYEDVKKYLEDYKDITSKLIMDLDADVFENLEKAMDGRMEALKNINKLGLEPSFIKNICNELHITEEDKKLQKLIEMKKESVYEEIRRMKTTKAANNSYTIGGGINPMYISKKI